MTTDGPDENPSPANRHTRRTKQRRREPFPENFTLRHADGSNQNVGPRRDPAAVSGIVNILDTARFRAFEACPICLGPTPTSREHVPPASLGGEIMTMTCDRCNHTLGSRVEKELTSWHKDALGARFSREGIRGARAVPPVYIRETDEGEFVILVDSLDDDVMRAMFSQGEIEVQWTPADSVRVRYAILKSAFLAACLFLEQFPRTPLAEQIRSELLYARDLPRTEKLELKERVGLMGIGRITDVESKSSAVELATIVLPGDAEPTLVICLARTIFVPWPLETLYAKIHTEAGESAAATGSKAGSFLHPTLTGHQSTGWHLRSSDSGCA